ncbi:MAG: flippase-like domain-containing protein [Gemmatimonadetes bacterium]|nr:flippase-like domain-containing protein [Gemmatimonadota bacterium]
MRRDSAVTERRRRALTVMRVAISVLLLVALFWQVDLADVWASIKNASFSWLGIALGVYFVHVLASTWRWHLLLSAQDVHVPQLELFRSLLVSYFFNNFLPSNIGGDVVRISDTAKPARSKTLATLVILADRVLGVIGLFLVAAIAATAAASRAPGSPVLPFWLWLLLGCGAAAVLPALVAPTGVGRLLGPLTILHPEWVGDRIDTVTATLERFRARPGVLASCFTGAVLVQTLIVCFYVAVGHALRIPIGVAELAVIVPISLVLQMLPVSVNGFGVREAAFSFYFTRLGLPVHSAVLLSLVATFLTMLFSLSWLAVYVSRSAKNVAVSTAG